MHYVAYLNPAVCTSIAVHIQHTGYRLHAKNAVYCVYRSHFSHHLTQQHEMDQMHG